MYTCMCAGLSTNMYSYRLCKYSTIHSDTNFVKTFKFFVLCHSCWEGHYTLHNSKLYYTQTHTYLSNKHTFFLIHVCVCVYNVDTRLLLSIKNSIFALSVNVWMCDGIKVEIFRTNPSQSNKHTGRLARGRILLCDIRIVYGQLQLFYRIKQGDRCRIMFKAFWLLLVEWISNVSSLFYYLCFSYNRVLHILFRVFSYFKSTGRYVIQQ